MSARQAKQNGRWGRWSQEAAVAGPEGGAGKGTAGGNDTLRRAVSHHPPSEVASVLNTAIPLAGYKSTASLVCMGQTKPSKILARR